MYSSSVPSCFVADIGRHYKLYITLGLLVPRHECPISIYKVGIPISVLRQQSASSSKSQQGARGGPIPSRFSYLVGRLHCCAYTSDSTANKDLLTAQGFPLSEASLSRQQVFGVPCATALAGCIPCCCRNILQRTAVLFCHYGFDATTGCVSTHLGCKAVW